MAAQKTRATAPTFRHLMHTISGISAATGTLGRMRNVGRSACAVAVVLTFFTSPELSACGFCPPTTECRTEHDERGKNAFCAQRQGTQWRHHGPFRAWYENDHPAAQGNFFAGEKHGLFRMWYHNGAPMSHGGYAHNRRIGTWMSWHPDGRPFIRANFVDDDEEGPWVSWWEEGHKSAEGSFHQGWEHGRWTFWYPQGPRSAEGAYLHGKREGWWNRWDSDGRHVALILYHDGVEISGAQVWQQPPP